MDCAGDDQGRRRALRAQRRWADLRRHRRRFRASAGDLSPGRSQRFAPSPTTIAAWAPLVHAQSVSWNNEGFTCRAGCSRRAPPRRPARRRWSSPSTAVRRRPNARRSCGKAIGADLARAGYYLFLPNPRGSYGQGEAFTRANIRDFGGGDLARHPGRHRCGRENRADRRQPPRPDRATATAGSWRCGPTPRPTGSRQSSPARGLSDWSAITANGIDQWMIPFFGASVYDDPAPYWTVSAIRTIKSAQHAHIPLRRRARHRGAADPVGRILACAPKR